MVNPFVDSSQLENDRLRAKVSVWHMRRLPLVVFPSQVTQLDRSPYMTVGLCGWSDSHPPLLTLRLCAALLPDTCHCRAPALSVHVRNLPRAFQEGRATSLRGQRRARHDQPGAREAHVEGWGSHATWSSSDRPQLYTATQRCSRLLGALLLEERVGNLFEAIGRAHKHHGSASADGEAQRSRLVQ